jgi:hypothetical protein
MPLLVYEFNAARHAFPALNRRRIRLKSNVQSPEAGSLEFNL